MRSPVILETSEFFGRTDLWTNESTRFDHLCNGGLPLSVPDVAEAPSEQEIGTLSGSDADMQRVTFASGRDCSFRHQQFAQLNGVVRNCHTLGLDGLRFLWIRPCRRASRR